MKSTLTKILCIGVLCLAIAHSTLSQQQKYALIIGVKSYQYVAPLQNSLNDARDMSATLKKKGFTVVEVFEPATKRIMQDGIIRYFKLLQGQPNAAGLVFYSGHGMQVKGINYLIPAQANPQIEADLDDQCVNMDYVMRAIQEAGNRLNIFVLDACRNNPFRSFSRSGENGLSMVDTPQGSYIVYATKPGSVASDGTGRNGLFTSKLLQYINTEGLNIEQVFKQVARDVASESGNEQRPWIASDYTGDFYFTPGLDTKTSAAILQPSTQPEIETSIYKAPTNINSTLDYGYGTSDAPTIKIDTQEWIGKNLNTDHFANGDPIQEAKTADEWNLARVNKQPAWCYHYNDAAKGPIYGKLYNWYAVSDPRGLAPKGWHVPSDKEWDILIGHLAVNGEVVNKVNKNRVGGSSYESYETKNVGYSLKSTRGWTKIGGNRSGFSGLAGGQCFDNGIFTEIGKSGSWWSASEGPREDQAWYRNLNGVNDTVSRNVALKGCGFSVRCVKD